MTYSRDAVETISKRAASALSLFSLPLSLLSSRSLSVPLYLLHSFYYMTIPYSCGPLVIIFPPRHFLRTSLFSHENSSRDNRNGGRMQRSADILLANSYSAT
jgi:hypothetical protein